MFDVNVRLVNSDVLTVDDVIGDGCLDGDLLRHRVTQNNARSS
jgi:hypothetical protein